MKLLLITLAFISTSAWTFQPDSDYMEAMQKNIQALFEAQTVEELQVTVNAFERIAQAEAEEWHPLYYASLGSIMMGTRAGSPEDIDKYLDQATEVLQKAMLLKPVESELIALEGFIHMIRTTVDPASRGQQYSGMAMHALGKAVLVNPANPRALFLLAQMQFGTAIFFGSDTSEACATLDEAIKQFERFEPPHPLDPAWGKERAIAMKPQCE